jgi:hypothetical protein
MRLMLFLILLALLSQPIRPERSYPDLRRQQHLDAMTMQTHLPNAF